jgi:hypothetical protein
VTNSRIPLSSDQTSLPPTIDDNVAGFHPLINTKLLEAEEVKPRIYIMSRRWDHNAESDSELATAL